MTKNPLEMKINSIIKLIFFIAMLLLLSADGTEAAKPVQDPKNADWVIMIYMDADNNLEDASIFAINQLERVGSTEDVKIIAQWDRNPNYDSSNGNWADTKRFMILKDYDNNVINSQEIEDLGEVDMGSMNSLMEFINWTKERYPAEKYALIMWNHGGGWTLGAFDETSNTSLAIHSLSNALKEAGFHGERKLDLLVFDECLMGLMDIAYSMIPYAKVMVASEDVVPGLGIDYVGPLSQLIENPSMDERQLSQAILLSYEDYYRKVAQKPYVTMAAYDLEKMPTLINATINLSTVLMRNMNETWPKIGLSLSYSEAFTRSEGLSKFKQQFNYYDLIDFADLLKLGNSDIEIEKSVKDLEAAKENALIAEYHGDMHPYAHGLTIYFPEDETLYSTDYPNASDFASETNWNQFLLSYIDAEGTINIEPIIEIDSISPQPSNMSNPARILGNVTANNIAYLSRSIGKADSNGFAILNEHELYRYYINDIANRRLPEFIDGRNNIDFTWAPIIDVLTNGQESVIAPARPSRQQEYYFTIEGKYKSRNEAEPFPVVLFFDYRTGKMLSAVKLGETLINEFEPKAGDIFTPGSMYYDKKKEELKFIDLAKITVGECGIWIEPRLLTKGNYSIGLYVEDLSGNSNWAWKTVNISGQPISLRTISVQDISGTWVGYGPYEETEFTFEFSIDELSEDDKEQLRSIFNLGFPNCNIWRWGNTTINTMGKEEKVALSAYRLWNLDGLTLLTIILFPQGESGPIPMTFLADIQGNKLHLRDIYQSGDYSLSREPEILKPN